MEVLAFQDYYPDHLSYWYGCRTVERARPPDQELMDREWGREWGREFFFWGGGDDLNVFEPQAYLSAIPGYLYGGLLFSIIDCHGTGSADAAAFSGRGTGHGHPVRQPFFDGVCFGWTVSSPRRWIRYGLGE